MTDIIKTKKEFLRNEMLNKRDLLSTDERFEKSTEIASRLVKLPEIIKAESIFTYVSFRSEVDTHRIIDSFLVKGKVVSVPLSDMKKKVINPFIIKSLENDLVPGVFGILEPDLGKIDPVIADKIDIVIMPGAAFSENGCRIGYGGGFYDRFLQQRNITSYALAFDFQLVDEVPFDPEFDVKVDYIVTERRVIECR
jgi:5-formyltetrahydrofolate cyclo-ligase